MGEYRGLYRGEERKDLVLEIGLLLMLPVVRPGSSQLYNFLCKLSADLPFFVSFLFGHFPFDSHYPYGVICLDLQGPLLPWCLRLSTQPTQVNGASPPRQMRLIRVQLFYPLASCHGLWRGRWLSRTCIDRPSVDRHGDKAYPCPLRASAAHFAAGSSRWTRLYIILRSSIRAAQYAWGLHLNFEPM